MALDKADLEALGSFIRSETSALLEDFKKDFTAETAQQTADAAVQNRVSVVGKPDVDPEAGPKYYVHLANGDVIESYDSGSTHMAVEGSDAPVAVIGRYQMGA